MARDKRGFLYQLLRIEPGLSLVQWVYDRIANNWDRIATAFIAGGGMSYLAAITDWSKAWGAVGVGIVGLTSAVVVYLTLSVGSVLRASAHLRRAKAVAIEKWRDVVDNINLLDQNFERKRISISDMANPISSDIAGKNFTNCELVGPANILLMDMTIINSRFTNCDAVVVKLDTPIQNAVTLRNSTIIGSTIAKCNVFIPPQMIQQIHEIGVPFISLTGVEEIDNPLPPNIAP